MSRQGGLPPVQIDPIVLTGGLDQITPTLSLKNGYARHALNFECAVTGGYTRIAGYERFDGHPSPWGAATSTSRVFISVNNSATPAFGDAITTSGGASGTVDYVGSRIYTVNGASVTYLYLGIISYSGTFNVGDTVNKGGTTIGPITDAYVTPINPQDDATTHAGIADGYRAQIAAVPGSGPVRGVFYYNGTVYAFRDNAGATASALYKSSAAGWVLVPYYYTVSFTGGTTAPADGATLTQGGVTAVIKRVVLQSGTWSGSAAGKFVIVAPSGGNFAAGAATVGATTVTLAGAQTQITRLPGGTYEFAQTSFAGQASSIRVYGCDGVNKAFEFDGDVLVPISTGAATDTPAHIAVHRKYLFLSIGSSIMYSAPGLPYDWTAIDGAGEIATGETVTAMVEMPGGANYAGATNTLCVTSRNNTDILYGSSASDWNLVSYNTGTGAVAYSLVNMAQTLGFDDRGATSIQAALQYGNFTQTTITNAVIPFITQRSNLFSWGTLCRRKSQYRLYFSDGYGLHISIVNGNVVGCMPVYFPNPVYCAFEGKDTNGKDVIFFGSTNGMVYQMETGSSFDGTAIDYLLVLNYSNAKGPRTLKRFRKAAVEVTADPNTFAEFNIGSVIGYDSLEYAQPIDKPFQSYVGSSRWDEFTWDNFFWDTSSMTPIECSLEGTAENIALMFNGTSSRCPSFTINSILVHYTPRRLMR